MPTEKCAWPGCEKAGRRFGLCDGHRRRRLAGEEPPEREEDEDE